MIDPTQGIWRAADARGVTYPSSAAAPEKNQRDLLTLVTGALASLVLIGTSLAALNKNVIGFRAWPGTSNEPTPSAVLPAAEPAVSSTRATFGFNGPDGTASLAIVGLPGAGLPGFRPPVAPAAGGPGLGTRTTIGEAPVGPPAPVIPGTPAVTPTPAPVTPVASAPVTVGPVPTSITAPSTTTKADRKADDKSDRKAEKGRRKAEQARGNTGTAAAPQATAAAAPVAQAAETTRESTASAPAATKGNGKNTGPQRRHEERKGKASDGSKESRRSAPAAAPAPPAAVAPPAPAPAPAGPPSVGPEAPGDGPGNAGRPDKGPKGGKGGKGRGPF